ncbi:hypothetical protein A5662_17640 [Mycobacteriaceae bacterium 1482268.1]|nr:hypothetical protein A5662_17640 [Mycobacteriaceae bacterium 1482268.1]
MWDEAAKWLNKFDEAVLTVRDADGYPASVRVRSKSYDAATGELAVSLPEVLRAVEGPANLMCHSHDEKLWSLQMMSIKGTLVNSDGTWIFRSESFQPPSKLAFVDFIRNCRRSAQKYLDKRDLARPDVNWAAIKEIQRRAKG